MPYTIILHLEIKLDDNLVTTVLVNIYIHVFTMTCIFPYLTWIQVTIAFDVTINGNVLKYETDINNRIIAICDFT